MPNKALDDLDPYLLPLWPLTLLLQQRCTSSSISNILSFSPHDICTHGSLPFLTALSHIFTRLIPSYLSDFSSILGPRDDIRSFFFSVALIILILRSFIQLYNDFPTLPECKFLEGRDHVSLIILASIGNTFLKHRSINTYLVNKGVYQERILRAPGWLSH